LDFQQENKSIFETETPKSNKMTSTSKFDNKKVTDVCDKFIVWCLMKFDKKLNVENVRKFLEDEDKMEEFKFECSNNYIKGRFDIVKYANKTVDFDIQQLFCADICCEMIQQISEYAKEFDLGVEDLFQLRKFNIQGEWELYVFDNVASPRITKLLKIVKEKEEQRQRDSDDEDEASWKREKEITKIEEQISKIDEFYAPKEGMGGVLDVGTNKEQILQRKLFLLMGEDTRMTCGCCKGDCMWENDYEPFNKIKREWLDLVIARGMFPNVDWKKKSISFTPIAEMMKDEWNKQNPVW